MYRDKGLVSIITPTYNCAPYIGETIECVINQSYTNWEMIIIDDCSTDNTKEIVESFNDRRIKYHCLEKNSGAAMARNLGLSLANGKWIAFLDSDDLWTPDKLEKQLKFMTDHGSSFSYTKYEEIDDNGHRLGKVISGPKRISKLGMTSYCWPGCLTVMFNRNVVGTIQIPDIKKNNDYAMWLMVIKKADCHLLAENLAQYRKRTGSISNHSYMSLIKWHYRLFRSVERSNVLSAFILTMNNLFWGVLKKIFYVQQMKADDQNNK